MMLFERAVRVLAAGAAAWAALGGGAAQAILIVSPNAQAAVEGNSNNSFPFNIAGSGDSSQRYQQVYGSSDFGALGGVPMLINQIGFRPDAGAGAFNSTLPDVRIDLSTTAASVDALSTTFASNVGANDTIVFGGAGGGPLALSSSFTGPVGGPKTFDILINLATPFLYDPAAGNLLLDVRNFGGGSTTQFDAQNSADAVSRGSTFDTNGVNDATTGFTDSLGLVTRFNFVPQIAQATPEPGTLSLMGAGIVGLAGWRRRKQLP